MESRQERSGSGVATIEKPRPSINETLRGFFDSREKELSRWSRQISDPHDTEALLEWYRKSSGFRKLKAEVKKMTDSLISPGMVNRQHGIAARAIGNMFGELSLTHSALIAFIQPEPKVILTSEETFKLFRLLFPKAKIIEHPNGQDSLEFHEVPDSVIIEKPRAGTPFIKEALEYSLITGKEREEIFRKKLYLFLMQQQDPEAADEASGLLANVGLKFFIAKINPSSPPDVVGKLPIEQSPFSRAEIRRFMRESFPIMRGIRMVKPVVGKVA